MTGDRSPECPNCGQIVYRTHTCRYSTTRTPSVPKPSDFAEQVARARAASRAQQESLPIEQENP